MFSFHKPRIYRSASGCCICRAKSSSSRFTDSRRYEGDFYACFKLGECRTGDICNACVLLVKRWKKLPKGSQRNWHHVVDARAGHGSKPISKINKVKKPTGGLSAIAKAKPGIELSDKMRNVMKKHIGPSDAYRSSLGRAREHSPSGCSDDVQMDCISSESGSYHSSLAASPTPSEVGDDEVGYNNAMRIKKLKGPTDSVHSRALSHQQLVNNSSGTAAKTVRSRDASQKTRRNSDASHSSFLDLSFWKREKTCCGIIFKGPCGEVLLDRRFLSPCFLRSVNKGGCAHSAEAKLKSVQRPIKSETCTTTGTDVERNCSDGASKNVTAIPVDCISVDSGYDDSSNSTSEAFKPLASSGFKNGCLGGKPIPPTDAFQASCNNNHEAVTVVKKPLVAISNLGEQPGVASVIVKEVSPAIVPSLPCEPCPVISTN